MYNSGCQGHRIGWRVTLLTAIRFWWLVTRFFLASKHICKMQIRHSTARAEWFPWDAGKFGPTFYWKATCFYSSRDERGEDMTMNLWMPLHVVSRFHQVHHFRPRQHLSCTQDVWLSIPSPGLVDHAWPWPEHLHSFSTATSDSSHAERQTLICHMSIHVAGFRATWSIRSWWHWEAWSYWPCCWDVWRWRRNGCLCVFMVVAIQWLAGGLPMKLIWTS